jgi:poly-gamma-glutamate capsule biosynthesis protein CapA/YwtB (metallophosphatase superfamily)
MPMVPVVDFWSSVTDISVNELTRALKGQSAAWPKVIVAPDDRQPLASALGINIADTVEAGTQDDIRAKTRQGYLAVIRASDLDARIRALSLGGKDLVGVDHITKLSDWPLIATVTAPASDKWTAGGTWTINAGGDMFLDRGVRNTTLEKGMGVNYPFDGGTAKVTGHCRCSPSQQIPNELVPIVKRTGNAGMVREFVMAANLTLANLENPVPDSPTWHLSGTHFGGPPRLLPMFTNAGIDWVSLANNHMADYGSDGIIQTRKHLTTAGIPFSGAGRNLAEAGQIAYLQANGLKVGIVACVLVPGVKINASDSHAGTFGCKTRFTLPKIAEARQNADVVIVFAHWGNEFHRDPFDSQITLAQKWVDAGADLVLGAHTHVYGGLQELSGKPVVYSMGNFIFDQYWSTPTMESALTEITFQGTRVVQIRLHPYVILDQAQPNFLNPATDDGKALLEEVKTVSDKLGW